MKISRTNKIILVIGIIYIIFTVFVALYLRKPQEPEQIASREFIKDYEVVENMLKSSEAGFSMTIPQEWETIEYGKGIGVFKKGTLDLESATQEPCLMGVDIARYGERGEIEKLANSISEVEKGEKQDDEDYRYKLLNVSGRVFLIIEFHQEDNIVYVIAKTPADNMIYSISSGLVSSPECLEQFNNSLQTVSIE